MTASDLEVFQSVLDPEWSCGSYYNGYFYFRSADPDKTAVTMRLVPIGVRKELDKRGLHRMKEHDRNTMSTETYKHYYGGGKEARSSD